MNSKKGRRLPKAKKTGDRHFFYGLPSQCTFCRWKRLGNECEAFPAGIPDLILANEFDHRLPHPEDGGGPLRAQGRKGPGRFPE